MIPNDILDPHDVSMDMVCSLMDSSNLDDDSIIIDDEEETVDNEYPRLKLTEDLFGQTDLILIYSRQIFLPMKCIL